jgi:hypothetical protein
MAEAMATGTPVIASRNGSTPEVIADGMTGFVCATVKEMIEAVPKVVALDRAACRRHVETHFSGAAMADGYEAVYRRVLDETAPAIAVHAARQRVDPHEDLLIGEGTGDDFQTGAMA